MWTGTPHDKAWYSQTEPRQFLLIACELADDIEGWEAWPSADLLEPDGLATFARRTLNLLQNGLPDAMLVELPQDPRDVAWREDGWHIRMPASGGDELDNARKFIRDLCLRHRGEVREVQGSGYWKPWVGALPHSVFNPQFAGSFIRLSGNALGSALASGSSSSSSSSRFGGEVDIRMATVFSLEDLFFQFGENYTAAELYKYFMSCRVIATRKVRRQRAY